MESIAIKTEFMKRKVRQIIVAVLIVPIVGVLFYVTENLDALLFGLNYDQIGLVALVIIGLALIFSFKNWRCPNCKKYTGKKIAA